MAPALLSGFAGLGGETLLFKLLDDTVGSVPVVSATVVAMLLLGLGVGQALSPKIQKPWRVEATLALWPLTWLFGFGTIKAINAAVLSAAAPHIGTNLTCVLLAAAYVAPWAILLGISLPAIIELSRSTGLAYATQALGAIGGLIAMEALLYPQLGLPGGLLALCGGHAACAWLLRRGVFLLGRPRFERLPMTRPPALLVLAGAASGSFQGLWLFLAQLLFQPFYFVQPAVVGAMLLGQLLGSRAWLRLRFDFRRVLILAAVGTSYSLAAIAVLVRLPQAESIGSAILQILLVLLPAASFIGALFPAFLPEAADRGQSGGALFGLSLGNALGIFMSGLVSAWIAPAMTVCLPLLLLAITAVLAGKAGKQKFRPSAGLAMLLLLSLLVAGTLSDAKLIQRIPSHHDRRIEVLARFQAASELSAIYRVEVTSGRWTRRLYQSGLSPIDLDTGAEAAIAVVGSAYAKDHRRALVLGAGSGKSAGVVAAGFQHTDVVDVGATVPELLRALEKDNHALLSRENVRYFPTDAILAPEILEPGYDLIVLTVDPSYHTRAAKLYTEEFFRAVSALLTPGGVFVFWADRSSSSEANQILINTGRSVFPHQKLFLAQPGPRNRRALDYYFLVHSSEVLRYDFERKVVRDLVELDEATAHYADDSEPHHLPAEGRVHPTLQTHGFFRPAAAILLGGFNQDRVKVRSEPDAP